LSTLWIKEKGWGVSPALTSLAVRVAATHETVYEHGISAEFTFWVNGILSIEEVLLDMVQLFDGCFAADETTSQTLLDVAYHAESIADFFNGSCLLDFFIFFGGPELLADLAVAVSDFVYA